jgi:Dienelactone hydrolase family
VARTKKLFAALTRRGPHRVLRGDLAFAGLPGIVYTPESGLNLPGVVFGHDWLAGADRYARTLEHLASWGIVAAAPDTETGVAPSVLDLAFDLGSTLDIISGVRLGTGKISVHPTKLGVAGHGFGASAAVFAAAGLGDKLKSTVAIFPSVSQPPAEQPAAGLRMPGLILAAPNHPTSIQSNATALNGAWRNSTMRTVAKAKPGGLVEGFRLTRIVGLPGADRGTQKAVRALLTGYLLHTLAGDKTYEEFSDPEVSLPRTVAPEPEAPPLTIEDKVVALLKR